MAEQYYPEDVLFGFEYETLIEAKQEFWDLVTLTVENIGRGVLDNLCNDVFKDVKSKVLEFDPESRHEMIETLFTEVPYFRETEHGMIDTPSTPNYNDLMDSSENLEIRITKADKIPYVVYRFLLAAIFNYIIRTSTHANLKKYNFKAQTSYEEGTICDTFNIDIQNRLIRRSERSLSEKNWAVTYDGSVRRIYNEPLYKKLEGKTISEIIAYIRNIEIVSPVLTYGNVVEDFEDIMNIVFPANKMLKYWNNHLTSNHIHMSHPGYNFRHHPLGLVKLCMAWWYVEPIIMLMMGPWRRNNRYCQPIHNRMVALFKNKATLKKVFKELNELNIVNEYLVPTTFNFTDEEGNKETKSFSKEYFEIGNEAEKKEALMYAIVYMFQGDIEIKSSRYTALNLLNLKAGGINTVEIRVKHGSADAKESKMFMLLLANFLSAVITKPCITYMDNTVKELFFELKTILNHPFLHDWTSILKVYSNTKWDTRSTVANKDKIQRAFDIFMNWINLDTKNEIRKYWQKRLNYVIHGKFSSKKSSSSSSSSGTSKYYRPPLQGGTMLEDGKQSREYTPFGYVDYDKLAKTSIKNHEKRLKAVEKYKNKTIGGKISIKKKKEPKK